MEYQLDQAIANIKAHPGPVLCTIVDEKLYKKLDLACNKLNLPCVPLLDRALAMLSGFFSIDPKGKPGIQHTMNKDYFARIDAMDYAMRHDDGQLIERLADADVILLGVSRTSKTPTSIYLANRGIKAANFPLVPHQAFPSEFLTLTKPVFVGLISSPTTLMDLRRSRLRNLGENETSSYTDVEAIKEEVRNARRLSTQNQWPIIDVSRRSIEETAAQVIKHLNRHRQKIGLAQAQEIY